MEPKAYLLRITLGDINSLQLALDTDTIIIGWSKAVSLLNKGLDREQFRQVLIDSYPDYKDHPRSSGSATGNMWRFIREMERGDYVVVPHSAADFYVAQVEMAKWQKTSPARQCPICTLFPDEISGS